jgi:mannosyltransferase
MATGTLPLKEQKTGLLRKTGRGLSTSVWIVVAITAVAVLPRFVNLGRESLWWDEAVSVGFAKLSWPSFQLLVSRSEANMMFYHFLLRGWIHLGQSEMAIRSLSAIAGVLTIPVVYFLAKRMFGTKEAVLGALLLAGNTFHVQYSQEARAYSLAVLLVTLSSLFFVRAVELRSVGDSIGYVIATSLAVYTHLFAVLVFAAQLASLVTLAPRKVPWRQLLACVASIGLLCVPFAIFFLRNDSERVSWIQRPTPSDVYHLFGAFAGGKRGIILLYLMACLAAVVFSFLKRRDPLRPYAGWHIGFLLSWLLVPIVASLVMSLRTPIFLDRYLLVSLPAFLLLAAVGVSQIQPRWAFAGAVIILTMLMARSVYRFSTTQHKEDWRGATKYLLANGSPRDALIFFHGAGRNAFGYYSERDGNPGGAGKTLYFDGDSELSPSVYGHLREVYPRVWFIESHAASPALMRQVRSLQESLAIQYSEVSERRFLGVDVFQYSEAISVDRQEAVSVR